MSIKKIKENARVTLERNLFSNIWLLLLLVSLVCSVISGIPCVGFILAGPISYALARMFVKPARGDKKVAFEDLLSGLNEGFSAVLLLGIVRALFVFLWSLLFVIPGIVKSYAYAMSSYIQQDSENKDFHYCLDRSQEMMKGYKGKLFLLDLSFIGWYIVGALCLGIGTLWVGVYHSMARAHFYEELKAIHATSETASTSDSESTDAITPDAISAPASGEEKAE